MTTTIPTGRLGNQIIRNLAVSLIAKKHNLKVKYCNKELIQSLGLELYSGNREYEKTHPLTDDNFFSVYYLNDINYNLKSGDNFFQTKEITNFLYEYLHSNEVKKNIINKNPFMNRYNNNNDLYIHIRLTDVKQYNPGINYYLKAIQMIEFDNLFISTDEPEHDIIKQLYESYPLLKIIDYDEIKTFQFASTNKHIILSHGSFSAIIGYLSFFSNIYYPEYEDGKIWYGDMFSIKDWKKINIF
jgi:hypothetical protein